MTTCAIVLANGLSRRMGGVPKATLQLAGETLAARAVRRLRSEPAVADVVLNASDPFGIDVPNIPDAFAGHAGPLAGILAGMDWASANGHEAVVSIAVDTPFFPDDLVAALGAPDEPIVVAKSDRLHPVFARWNADLAPDLRAFLGDGGRKIMAFVERHPFETHEWPTDPDPFFNINTPEEYEIAKARAA